VRVGGNGFIDQLIGLCGVLRIQQLGVLNFGFTALGSRRTASRSVAAAVS
jgi:hypothetical protein